jgi:hypothetical protein
MQGETVRGAVRASLSLPKANAESCVMSRNCEPPVQGRLHRTFSYLTILERGQHKGSAVEGVSERTWGSPQSGLELGVTTPMGGCAAT